MKTHNNISFCTDSPDTCHLDGDGHQLWFSFRLSRQRKLNNKITIFFPDYPIIHTKDLATNSSNTCAGGPTIVLRMEKVTGISMMLTPIT